MENCPAIAVNKTLKLTLTRRGLFGCKQVAYKSTNTNQSNIMILNGVKTAMQSLPEAIANINALDDSERSCHDKSEIIEYVMDTLLQEYMETHNKIHEGVGYSKAKQLLQELSEDL